MLTKRLKYGLSNKVAVILYELGFADRVIAEDLSTIFDETYTSRDLVILLLRARREDVFAKLDVYPSYFSDVYKNRVTRAR
jgi:POLQ-like helicase